MPETDNPSNSMATPRRRDLLQWGIGAAAASYTVALGYPVYRYLATPAVKSRLEGEVSTVTIPDKDIPGKGTALMFLFGGRPAMLIHHEDDRWVAFDAVCSHLGCTVGFQPQNHRIYCPCHGGTYDMNTGEVVAGPPPRALKPYHVEVKDGHIVISRA